MPRDDYYGDQPLHIQRALDALAKKAKRKKAKKVSGASSARVARAAASGGVTGPVCRRSRAR